MKHIITSTALRLERADAADKEIAAKAVKYLASLGIKAKVGSLNGNLKERVGLIAPSFDSAQSALIKALGNPKSQDVYGVTRYEWRIRGLGTISMTRGENSAEGKALMYIHNGFKD